jgi:hypothetical protein
VNWLFDRVDAEKLANVLVAHGFDFDDADEIGGLGQYLSDVREFMERLRPEQKQPCGVCGCDIRRETDCRRPEVRYCSAACRQRAYRARVTARQAGRTVIPSRSAVCDTSRDLSVTPPVTLRRAG